MHNRAAPAACGATRRRQGQATAYRAHADTRDRWSSGRLSSSRRRLDRLERVAVDLYWLRLIQHRRKLNCRALLYEYEYIFHRHTRLCHTTYRLTCLQQPTLSRVLERAPEHRPRASRSCGRCGGPPPGAASARNGFCIVIPRNPHFSRATCGMAVSTSSLSPGQG